MIKKILVPTDFSKNADNALLYAIQLANQFEAEVELVHAYDAIATTGTMASAMEYVRENAERDLLRTIKKYKEYLNYGTKLTGRVLQSTAIEAIISAGRSKELDLIVMGTKGASGIKKLVFGSVTEAIMQKVNTPLLAIPVDFEYRPPKEITLSLDAHTVIEDRDTFKPLLSILEIFYSKLSILHVMTDKNRTDFDHDIVDLVKEKNIIHFNYKLNGHKSKINKSLKEFNDAFPTDMLCMIRREKGYWNRLFTKSNTTEEIFNCSVPLLILKEK
jgi:Universal stress protein UspA and related nucleotide-binding proteins